MKTKSNIKKHWGLYKVGKNLNQKFYILHLESQIFSYNFDEKLLLILCLLTYSCTFKEKTTLGYSQSINNEVLTQALFCNHTKS